MPYIGDIVVELELWGSSADDICFGPGEQVLFSSRLKAAFESSQLKGTGFQFAKVSKVKSHKKGRPDIPSYYLTSIGRSQAIVDPIASGMEWESKVDCEECHLDGILKRFRRIVLVPDTWSGEDIFFARGLPGTIITSQRFQETIVSIGLTAELLIPINEFSIDLYPWEK